MRKHRQTRALSGDQTPNDRQILDAVERMGKLAHDQVTQAKEAFKTRDVTRARNLVGQSARIGRLNREIFNRAVEIGDDLGAREWAMFMILAARTLERIADNAVEIAKQTTFVVTGLFGESPDESQRQVEDRENGRGPSSRDVRVGAALQSHRC